jgi:EpsI family protein
VPRERNELSSNSVVWRTVVVAVAFVATAVYLGVASRAEELPPREPLAKLPMFIAPWSGTRAPDLTPEVLAVLGADDYIMRNYSRPGAPPMGLYIGYHASQRQGDTIHSPLNCLPGAGWEPTEVGRTQIPVQTSPGASPRPIDVNRVIIAKGLDRSLVLYWYQSHRRVVASEYWGKVYTVLDSVRYHRTDAAMVRIIVPIPDGQDAHAAEEQAITFAQALFPLLPGHLPS